MARGWRRHSRDIDEMADLAGSLRRNGYLGMKFSPEAVDRLLAAAVSFEHMLALTEKSVELARSNR